jgi:myo-inositol-1(or 4)-monophosphatase
MGILLQETSGIRRIGSAAIDLCYVACGRVDGFIQKNLSPWDVAAGALIAERAGARVTDFSGGDDYLFGRQIIASNPWVYADYMNRVVR